MDKIFEKEWSKISKSLRAGPPIFNFLFYERLIPMRSIELQLITSIMAYVVINEDVPIEHALEYAIETFQNSVASSVDNLKAPNVIVKSAVILEIQASITHTSDYFLLQRECSARICQQIVSIAQGNLSSTVKEHIKPLADFFDTLFDAKQKYAGWVPEQVYGYLASLVVMAPEHFIENVKGGRSVKAYFNSALANRSADLLESGQFHIYRGILSFRGEELLRINDECISELLTLGDMTSSQYDKYKIDIRKNIKKVG